MKLEVVDTVVSTMDIARERVLSGAVYDSEPNTLRYSGILAREQTGGRGQRGRNWFAPRDSSLCATFYLQQAIVAPERAGELGLLAGVAIAEVVDSLRSDSSPVQPQNNSLRAEAVQSAFDAKIDPAKQIDSEQPSKSKVRHVGLKWPNDILLNGKKLGGVLIETVSAISEAGKESGNEEWIALIGVGINLTVSEFPPELSGSATSLLLEGIPSIEPERLGERIFTQIELLAGVHAEAGLSEVLRRWRCFDQTGGRRYETSVSGIARIGTACGIDERGALLLEFEDGSLTPTIAASALREILPVT